MSRSRLAISPVALLCAVLMLAACATPRPPHDTAANSPPAARGPAPPDTGRQAAAQAQAALAAEQQWLQSWFAGTPVLIAHGSDGVLTVDVPRDFCFDRGKASVKPALAAVLDKVAESLRRRPQTRLSVLAAPGDDTAASGLAQRRATQVRKHLLERGVPAARLAEGGTSTVPAVQLRIGVVAGDSPA